MIFEEDDFPEGFFGEGNWKHVEASLKTYIVDRRGALVRSDTPDKSPGAAAFRRPHGSGTLDNGDRVYGVRPNSWLGFTGRLSDPDDTRPAHKRFYDRKDAAWKAKKNAYYRERYRLKKLKAQSC